MTPFGTEVVVPKTSPLAIHQTSLVQPKETLPPALWGLLGVFSACGEAWGSACPKVTNPWARSRVATILVTRKHAEKERAKYAVCGMLITQLCCSCDRICSHLVVLDGATCTDKSICRRSWGSLQWAALGNIAWHSKAILWSWKGLKLLL